MKRIRCLICQIVEQPKIAAWALHSKRFEKFLHLAVMDNQFRSRIQNFDFFFIEYLRFSVVNKVVNQENKVAFFPFQAAAEKQRKELAEGSKWILEQN